MVTEDEYEARKVYLIALRRELKLAILAADPWVGEPTWGHYVWHYIPQQFRSANPQRAAIVIETDLQPWMWAQEDDIDRWHTLAVNLVPICRVLKRLIAGPIYGCPDCH